MHFCASAVLLAAVVCMVGVSCAMGSEFSGSAANGSEVKGSGVNGSVVSGSGVNASVDSCVLGQNVKDSAMQENQEEISWWKTVENYWEAILTRVQNFIKPRLTAEEMEALVAKYNQQKKRLRARMAKETLWRKRKWAVSSFHKSVGATRDMQVLVATSDMRCSTTNGENSGLGFGDSATNVGVRGIGKPYFVDCDTNFDPKGSVLWWANNLVANLFTQVADKIAGFVSTKDLRAERVRRKMLVKLQDKADRSKNLRLVRLGVLRDLYHKKLAKAEMIGENEPKYDQTEISIQKEIIVQDEIKTNDLKWKSWGEYIPWNWGWSRKVEISPNEKPKAEEIIVQDEIKTTNEVNWKLWDEFNPWGWFGFGEDGLSSDEKAILDEEIIAHDEVKTNDGEWRIWKLGELTPWGWFGFEKDKVNSDEKSEPKEIIAKDDEKTNDEKWKLWGLGEFTPSGFWGLKEVESDEKNKLDEEIIVKDDDKMNDDKWKFWGWFGPRKYEDNEKAKLEKVQVKEWDVVTFYQLMMDLKVPHLVLLAICCLIAKLVFKRRINAL